MDRKRISRLYFLLTAAFCFVGVALRAVCMLTQFDKVVGYFNRGFLSVADTVLYFIAVISGIVGACLLPKRDLPVTLRTPCRAPLAYAVGLALVAFTAISLMVSYEAYLTTKTIADWLLVISALPAAAYFLISARLHGIYRDAVTFVGFFPILWSASAVAITYSDPFVAMNSPIKVSIQMGLLGFMFIMLPELNCRLGKPVSRKAIAMTAIGTYAALVSSLPLLLSAWISPALTYTLCAIVLLAVGLYGGYMLFCYTCASSHEQEESALEGPCTPDTQLDLND